MNDDNIDHESLPLLRRSTTTSSRRRSQAVERARDHDHVMLQIATVALEDRTSQQRRRERLQHYMSRYFNLKMMMTVIRTVTPPRTTSVGST